MQEDVYNVKHLDLSLISAFSFDNRFKDKKPPFLFGCLISLVNARGPFELIFSKKLSRLQLQLKQTTDISGPLGILEFWVYLRSKFSNFKMT